MGEPESYIQGPHKSKQAQLLGFKLGTREDISEDVTGKPKSQSALQRHSLQLVSAPRDLSWI